MLMILTVSGGSQLVMFADDLVLYRPMTTSRDYCVLQNDMAAIEAWSRGLTETAPALPKAEPATNVANAIILLICVSQSKQALDTTPRPLVNGSPTQSHVFGR